MTPATRRRSRRRRPPSPLQLAMILVPTAWAAALVVPLFFALLIAFKSQSGYAQDPLGMPRQWLWGNFSAAWTQGNLADAFRNDAVVTVASVAGVVLLGSLAAYAIARSPRRRVRALYLYFLVGLIVPFQLGLPTLYHLWSEVGLVDNLGGVVLIQIGANLPLAVFLYVGGLRTTPLSLEEAARLDGAGSLTVFGRVVFPLLKPITATIVIFTALGVWNDLLVSEYFLQTPQHQTIAESIVSFMSEYSANWPLIFSCVLMALIPVLVVYVLLQRFFVSGLTAGAVRG